MKRCLTILAGMFMTGAAWGADMPLRALPPVAAYPMTGLYVGANAGMAFANQSYDFITQIGTSAAVGLPGKFFPAGTPVGGTVGWKNSFGPFLVGIEGDFDWNNNKGTAACAYPVAGPVQIGTTCGTKGSWIASENVIVGIPLGAIFGTGGLVQVPTTQLPIPIAVPTGITLSGLTPYAIVGVAERNVTGFADPVVVSKGLTLPGVSGKETLVGAKFGGGLSIPVALGWDARVEFDHYQFNKTFVPGVSSKVTPGLFTAANFRQVNEDTLKAVLTYGF